MTAEQSPNEQQPNVLDGFEVLKNDIDSTVRLHLALGEVSMIGDQVETTLSGLTLIRLTTEKFAKEITQYEVRRGTISRAAAARALQLHQVTVGKWVKESVTEPENWADILESQASQDPDATLKRYLSLKAIGERFRRA